MKKKLLILVLLLASQSSFSQVITARVKDYGWLSILPPLETLLDQAVEDLEADINKDQPIKDAKRFLEGTSSSTLLASKGLGSDYANASKNLLIGVSLGGAWDGKKDVAIEDEISGLAGASSLVVGTSWNRFLASMNFGNFRYGQTLPTGDIDILGGIKGVNFGMHLRYDWIDGKGDDWFGWGGVKVHLGYEYNRNNINLRTKINEELEIDTGQGVLRNQIQGEPRYEIETKTHSFPLEVSSNVRFLKIFTLYGGAGVDFNIGGSKGKGLVSSDVAPLVCINGLCQTFDALPEVEINANLNAKSNVEPLTYRYFGGLQIDLSNHLYLFGQGEKIIGTEVTGIAAGIRYSN